MIDDLSVDSRAMRPTLSLAIDPVGRVALFGIRLTDDQLREVLHAAASRHLYTQVVVAVPPGLAARHKSAFLSHIAKTTLAKVDFVEAN